MKNRTLTHTGIERAKTILRNYIEISKGFSENVIITGTSCSRESDNIYLLSDWLSKKYGYQYIVLSEQEEAELNGLANAVDFSFLKKKITFDIGGGSTEFTFMQSERIKEYISLPIGLRRLDNLFSKDKHKIRDYISDILQEVSQLHNLSEIELIGIGGTVTSLAAIKKRLAKYISEEVHKTYLSIDDINEIYQLISKSSAEGVRRLLAFEPMKADIFLIGITAVQEILKITGREGFYVSDKGLQYGILHETKRDIYLKRSFQNRRIYDNPNKK